MKALLLNLVFSLLIISCSNGNGNFSTIDPDLLATTHPANPQCYTPFSISKLQESIETQTHDDSENTETLTDLGTEIKDMIGTPIAKTLVTAARLALAISPVVGLTTS